MESRVKLFGHPVHQMLVPLPFGVLGMAVLFDLIAAFGDRESLAQAASYMIGAGILTGLLAAVFGAIDWNAIPSGTRAKRIGAMHGLGNVIVVVVFAAAWLIRRDDSANPSGFVLGLEVVAFAGALVTGWLGGELVDRLGVGVDRGAHLDAPSSLSGRPAHDNTG